MLLEKLNWRYATKIFDPTKKLSDDQWQQLKTALILSPSSYGLQPYKFIVITDQTLKEKLVAHSWNQTQPKDCSHFVVFAGLRTVTEEYTTKFVNLTANTIGVEPKTLDAYKRVIVNDLVKGPRSKVINFWAANQTYIALGNLMTSAAILGVDTCPMEGIVPGEYDKLLDLKDSPYQTLVACALGFRSEKDKYATRKKVRFSETDLITE